MTSVNTRLLFLALLLVYSHRAVSGNWISTGSPVPGTALLSFNVTPSSSLGNASFRMPGFTLEEVELNGINYAIPLAENASPLLELGAPDLPQFTFTLQVPASGNFEAILISGKYQDFPGISIFPSFGNLVHGAPVPEPVFGAEYASDAFYPGILSGEETPYIARNERYQAFRLLPFQYNPVTKVLRVYYEMEIGFQPIPGQGTNPLTAQDLKVSGMKELQPSALNFSGSHLKSGSLPQEKGKMLIICPQSFRETIKPFIEWKTATGLDCQVADAALFTDAAALADYVKNEYYHTGNLAYLLLVGDAEQVPSIMLPLGASDNSYGYIAGDDHYPDILVGRFSASTVKELETQVKKTLQYEKDPGSDASWLSDATGIASTLSPGDDGEADFEHVANLLGQLNGFTYTNTNAFFDGNQGGGDAEGDPSASDIMEHLNAGTGMILYTGHGTTSAWGTGHLNRTDVSSINNKGKFPFIWSVACETGNFAGSTCLAESWMRAGTNEGEPLGAVAALMASGTQTSCPPMEAQDEMVNCLANAGNSGTTTFGGISVSGMYKMNDVYGKAGTAITDTWILFGDPSLQLRTSMPSVMQVEHPGIFGLGMTEFSIHADISSGYAALSCQGVLLGAAPVVNGYSNISLLRQPDLDALQLTVTSFNYLPFIAEIPVTKFPAQPGDCMPINHSQRIPIAPVFNWDEGNGATPEHYLFYLGTNNPPSNLVNGLIVTEKGFRPDFPLDYLTTYYWRVDAVNENGTATGAVNDFFTIYGPDEDFEKESNTDSKWVVSGTEGWQIDTNTFFQGFQSCRSGITADGEYSSIIFNCEVESCDFVGFWYKISSGAGDRLQFLVDGNLMQEWSGLINWTYASFSIEPGNHQIEWRYQKDGAGTSGDDAAWLDDISLPVHSKLLSQFTDQATICEGTSYIPQSHLENFTAVTWETEGDGSFADPMLMSPEYTPGENDREKGGVLLTMKVYGFDGCSVLSMPLQLTILSAPIIPLPDDTISEGGTPVMLDAWTPDATSYLWMPGNETSSYIVVDTNTLDRGVRTVTLQLTSQEGCVAQKSVRIHFNDNNSPLQYNIYPNPCKDNITLEPESGVVVLNKILLVNAEGKTLWQQEGNIEIIDKRNFKLPELPAATYFLIMQNSSGLSTRPLIIQ